MASATHSTPSVRLRDIRSLTRKQQAYVGVVIANLALGGALLGLYMNGFMSSPGLAVVIAAGNLMVGGLGLRTIDDMLREVSE